MRYDHRDFLASPGKYRLFTSARMATHLVTHNGEGDIEQDAAVSVAYRRDALCPLRRRVEPVYGVQGEGGQYAELFASSLKDFIL